VDSRSEYLRVLRRVVLAGSLVFMAAASWPPDFDFETIVTGLDRPTAFAYAPDGRLFITEKTGRVRVVSAEGVLLPTPFAIVSVNTDNDRGLIGVTLDPGFPVNHFIYLAYTTDIVPPNPINGYSRIHRITRMTANGDVAVPGSEVVIIDGIPSDIDSHAGGALLFGPDGKLYASTGDGSSYFEENALALRTQDVDQLVGKILRVNPDGSAPADNPFYAGPDANRSKVWQYGLRNPFRAVFRPGTSDLFINDVGWNMWEEIDQAPPGADFGWPCYEGPYPEDGYLSKFPAFCASVVQTPPVASYQHEPQIGAAITGGAFIQGSNYPPAYQGSYFFSDYALDTIQYLPLQGDGSLGPITDFASVADMLTPVDLTQGPDGNLQILSIASDFSVPSGRVARLIYVGSGNHAPLPVATVTPGSGYAPLDVALSSAGTTDQDGDPLTCGWVFGDGGQESGCELRHTYAANGSYAASLFVSDGQAERQATAMVTVGSLPPVATILTPAPTATYRTDETITFSGRADDPDEGQLGPQALRWTIIQHHNDHEHDYLDTTGSGGTFVAAAHGGVNGTVAYEVVLTATDSSGLSATQSVTLHENRPPFVSLGPDWTAACAPARGSVTLDGSASGDPDLQPLTYKWTETSGVPVSLTGDATPLASFAPPVVPGGTALTFHLVVGDGLTATGGDITITVPDLRDQDGDGDPFCSDCNDLDPSVSSPAQVAGLVLDPNLRTIRWSADLAPVTYDLYRGAIAGRFSYDLACLATGISLPEFTDDSRPPPGQAYYYLVRANNTCGRGSLGITTQGSSIPAPVCLAGANQSPKERPGKVPR